VHKVSDYAIIIPSFMELVQMKARFIPWVMVPILVILLLNSCAGLSGARRTEPADLPREAGVETAVVSVPPEIPRSALERAAAKVKADSPELRKYFRLQEEGASFSFPGKAGILVLGEIHDGDEEFEVRYDLSEKPDSRNQMKIGFTLHDKNAEMLLRDEFIWKIPEETDTGTNAGDAAPGLLLAFDDDFREAWENAFDLFDQYQARITFFIQGSYSPFCKRALDRGHDVGYHTAHHLDLRKLSREEFDRETLSAVEEFHREGIPLHSFAYPFGFSDPWMRDALAGVFPIQRGFGAIFRVYDKDAIKSGYPIARSIDNILFKRDDEFEAMIDAMLRTVKFTGGILPLTTHNISDTADWGIKPRRLEYLLSTARALKLKFYRYGDF
jgi:peptidoglycan/xylan/chitin deacetylase (PgdA/CDA1 family)